MVQLIEGKIYIEMIWKETKITGTLNKWEVQVIDILRVKLQEIYKEIQRKLTIALVDCIFFYEKGCSQPKGLRVGYISSYNQTRSSVPVTSKLMNSLMEK